jgi:hypothetical protein
MNRNLLTPFLFSQLDTDKEKMNAYNHLWDAYQTKKKRKSIINNELNEIHNSRFIGNKNSNAADRKAANAVIKYFWQRKRDRQKLTAHILYVLQKMDLPKAHLEEATVERWNTALRKIWKSQSWVFDDAQYEIFKKKVWDKHRETM